MGYLGHDKVCVRKKATCDPMRMSLAFPRYFLIALFGATFLFTGCATQGTGPVMVTKVNPYHFDASRRIRTDDEMIDFEHDRLTYGVVSNSEQRELQGNYFSVFWETETKEPATVRLEYRQGATGPKIYTKETFVADPGRKNVTKFKIIGEEYQKLGKVTQWKVSIIENGTVVAEYKSFLWN